MYNPNNVFAKILRGEIPSNKVFENEFALAFHNVHPRASKHVLVIPKGNFMNLSDFIANATPTEQAEFWAAVQKTVDLLDVGGNYRTLTNSGDYQGVPHFHIHILHDDKYKEDGH